MAQRKSPDRVADLDTYGEAMSVITDMHSAGQSCLAGMARYTTDFFIPCLISGHYFQRTESKRLLESYTEKTD